MFDIFSHWFRCVEISWEKISPHTSCLRDDKCTRETYQQVCRWWPPSTDGGDCLPPKTTKSWKQIRKRSSTWLERTCVCMVSFVWMPMLYRPLHGDRKGDTNRWTLSCLIIVLSFLFVFFFSLSLEQYLLKSRNVVSFGGTLMHMQCDENRRIL